jgi:hypothetical protein
VHVTPDRCAGSDLDAGFYLRGRMDLPRHADNVAASTGTHADDAIDA